MKNTPESEEQSRRDIEIVAGIEAFIATVCIIGYVSCVIINFVPSTTGNKLLVSVIFSWLFSTVLSLQMAKHLRGFSSYQMFREFGKAMIILLFLYLAGVASVLLLTNKTEPPRLAGAFSALPMFVAAILKSGNKPK